MLWMRNDHCAGFGFKTLVYGCGAHVSESTCPSGAIAQIAIVQWISRNVIGQNVYTKTGDV